MATESSATSPTSPQQGGLFAAPDRRSSPAQQVSTAAEPVVPYGELIEKRDGREARIAAARVRAERMIAKDEDVRTALERLDKGEIDVEALEEVMNTRRVLWLVGAADRVAGIDVSQETLWRANAAKPMSEGIARYEDLRAIDRMADMTVLGYQRRNDVAPPITTEPPVTPAVLIEQQSPALADLPAELLDAVAAKMEAGRQVLNAAGFNLFGDARPDSRYKEQKVYAETMNVALMAESWITRKKLMESGDRTVKPERVEYFWGMMKSALDGSDPIPCLINVDTRASDARIELGKDGEAEILGRFGTADAITAHAGDCREFLPKTIAKATADKKAKSIEVALRKAERDLANGVQKYEELRVQGLAAITNYDIVETFQGSAGDALESRLLMLQTSIRESRSRIRAIGLEVDAGGLFAGDASVGLGDSVARSLAEAERLAARRGEYSVADTSDGKHYDGRLTDLTPYHAIQSIGPKSVIHLKTALSGSPVLSGTRITVSYADGRGTVASPAHDAVREQQRGGLA